MAQANKDGVGLQVNNKFGALVKRREGGDIFEVIRLGQDKHGRELSPKVVYRRVGEELETYALAVDGRLIDFGLLPPELFNPDMERYQMKIKTMEGFDGNDGTKSIKGQVVVDSNPDFALRCIRLGQAEPVDDEGYRALARFVEAYGREVVADGSLVLLDAWTKKQEEIAAAQAAAAAEAAAEGGSDASA